MTKTEVHQIQDKMRTLDEMMQTDDIAWMRVPQRVRFSLLVEVVQDILAILDHEATPDITDILR